ncbi:unnamed protein product [Alopecurus aequalis]
MGACASRGRSASSLPVNVTLKETRSTTRLLTVDDYRGELVPVGTPLVFEISLLDITYRIQVYPSGFDKHNTEYIAIFVGWTGESIYFPRGNTAMFLIEILEGSRERRTVFDNFTAPSFQTTMLSHGRSILRSGFFNQKEASHYRGFIRFVKRKELEASGCLHGLQNRNFTIRCTVSVDVTVTRSLAEAVSGLSVDTLSSPALSRSHTLEIGSFSKLKATLQAGECAHSTQFTVGASYWFFKVYPNGHNGESKDVSIFLGRGRSEELATTAEFCFDFPGVMEGRPFTKCIFDSANPMHEFQCGFRSMDCDNDRLLVRCHLRVIKATEADNQPDQS